MLFLAQSRVVQSKSDDRLCFKALLYALLIAVAEICVLSFALHQQIEFRHLSSLLPLLLLLIMTGLSTTGGGRVSRNYIVFAAVALGVTWFVSDIRLLGSADYKREDFRSAVQKSIELHNNNNAVIAVAADPVAAAYYGLDIQGPKPCFPLTDSCSEGFAKVPWPKKVRAQYALFWSDSEISAWLANQKRSKLPVVLLISRSRHPMMKNSAWWPIIGSRTGAQLFPERGFYVYLLP
jgi:hypothetical protein